MTKEQDLANLLLADSTLMALLTGGVYTDEELGIQGMRRGDDSPTENAFDADGVLKPCAVVRQGAETAYGGIRSVKDQITGMTQPIEVYFYEDRGRDVIIAAKQRAYELLENRRLPASYPLIWVGDTPPFYDVGPVANSTTIRQSWRCVFLKRPSS
jgi:hypothetical protein